MTHQLTRPPTPFPEALRKLSSTASDDKVVTSSYLWTNPKCLTRPELGYAWLNITIGGGRAAQRYGHTAQGSSAALPQAVLRTTRGGYRFLQVAAIGQRD
jgi:hypothetical protein